MQQDWAKTASHSLIPLIDAVARVHQRPLFPYFRNGLAILQQIDNSFTASQWFSTDTYSI